MFGRFFDFNRDGDTDAFEKALGFSITQYGAAEINN